MASSASGTTPGTRLLVVSPVARLTLRSVRRHASVTVPGIFSIRAQPLALAHGEHLNIVDKCSEHRATPQHLNNALMRAMR